MTGGTSIETCRRPASTPGEVDVAALEPASRCFGRRPCAGLDRARWPRPKSSPTTFTGKRVMTHRVLPPTRVLAVIAPVCVAGFGVACAAAVSFAVTPHKTATIARARRAAQRLDPGRPLPGPGRGDRHRRRLALVRLRRRLDRALRLGRGPARRLPRAGDHAGARAAAAACASPTTSRSSRSPRPPRARSRRPCNGDGARRRARPRRRRRLGAVRGQPAADHRRRRGQRAPLALLAGAHERPRHDRPLLADGLGGADARRALGALAVPLGRARRAAARDPALPARDRPRAARDAARADRPADRASATTGTSTNGSSGSCGTRRRSVSRSPSASSTSTTSSGSTTASATRPATACSRGSPRACARRGEAFRLGGDEFALLLPGYDEDSALDRGGLGRRADRRARARADRLGHRQRRRRDLARARGATATS